MRNFFLKPIYLVGLGAIIIIAGFIYDGIFAGIPFQDPTPQMQATWLRHHRIGSAVVNFGLLVLLAGVLGVLVKKLFLKNKK